MGIDLSRFKVVYKDKVLKAISLQRVEFGEDVKWDETIKKPKFIEILAINEDGNIIAIHDEAWMFQFVTAIN